MIFYHFFQISKYFYIKKDITLLYYKINIKHYLNHHYLISISIIIFEQISRLILRYIVISLLFLKNYYDFIF